MDVWAYRVGDIYVLRRTPFVIVEMASARGQQRQRHEVQQGVHMHLPTAWDWKRLHAGRVYAGKGEAVYDITELLVVGN